jgi:hypothetical protein
MALGKLISGVDRLDLMLVDSVSFVSRLFPPNKGLTRSRLTDNNTTETLCNRWMQLAAFTPLVDTLFPKKCLSAQIVVRFYRNHNAKVDANGNYQLSQGKSSCVSSSGSLS